MQIVNAYRVNYVMQTEVISLVMLLTMKIAIMMEEGGPLPSTDRNFIFTAMMRLAMLS